MSSTSNALCADQDLDLLLQEIRACKACYAQEGPGRLPHEPRPVLRLSATARLFICSQAPGARVHVSGIPFSDPSGDRLRGWMGIDKDAFYDTKKVAFVPMGFCFPGYDANGGDLPPRKECAALWRQRIFDALPAPPELILLVGSYAQRWHLGDKAKSGLNETLNNWREFLIKSERPRYLPLPHPSWRNNGWLKHNPWFEAEVVPVLRREVAALIH